MKKLELTLNEACGIALQSGPCNFLGHRHVWKFHKNDVPCHPQNVYVHTLFHTISSVPGSYLNVLFLPAHFIVDVMSLTVK